MRASAKVISAVLLIVPLCLHAQSVTGIWQGTLGTAPRSLRVIYRVTNTDSGRLKVDHFSIDQAGFDFPYPADTVTFETNVLKAVFNQLRGAYVGTLSRDNSLLAGTWTQNGRVQPLALARATAKTAWRDQSPHRTRFIAVAPNVKLEVLDWGGTGRPVMLLAGAGASAHTFDQFATKLTDQYHVYAITRRGFGFSSRPTAGYSADRLADDVLAVLDSLRIISPVLVGHSLGGQELSSIGSRHSEKVAGLVYLDAGYAYSYYDAAQENVQLNINDIRRKLTYLSPSLSPKDLGDIIDELLATSIPVLERDMRAWSKRLAARPDRLVTPPPFKRDWVADSLFNGEQKFTNILGPVLAIYAAPREVPAAIANDSAAIAKADSVYLDAVMPQINAFQRGTPGARVIRIPHSNHNIFKSNEAEVLREIRAFIGSLAQKPQPGSESGHVRDR